MARTRRHTKTLSLRIWRWLADNPLRTKDDLPKGIADRVRIDDSRCPLCTMFIRNNDEEDCVGCPLNIKGMTCYNEEHKFRRWLSSRSIQAREDYAKKLVELIEAWDETN